MTSHLFRDLVSPLATAFGTAGGANFARPIDWDLITAAYVAEARRRDAENRFTAFIAGSPELAETDWNRSCFDQNRDAIASLIGWQPGKRGIIATGPTGRGKTRAMIALYRRLACNDGCDVRFYHAGDWFGALQAQINYGRDDARGWVEAVATRPIVMLDDFGQEAVQSTRAEWAQAWFFRFLDLRIARGLPLIVSTNLSAREIAGRTSEVRGDPMLRRMMDLCDVVKFV